MFTGNNERTDLLPYLGYHSSDQRKRARKLRKKLDDSEKPRKFVCQRRKGGV